MRNIIGQHELDALLQQRDSINARICDLVDRETEAWGIRIESLDIKDIEIPDSMQRAMAKEAEAAREKRARYILAEAERISAEGLAEAAEKLMANPLSIELRRLQTMAEIGTEHNTATFMFIPSEIMCISKMRELIESLIASARSFSYENFAEFSARGYPIRLTPSWVSWLSEVEQFLSQSGDRHPRSVTLFQQAKAIELIGCRKETFEVARGYITISLTEALKDAEYRSQIKRKKFTDIKVFIVHGTDTALRCQLKDYLQNTLHLHEPIILDEKPGRGRTIIEKFEEESSDVDIVFVLLTPDDEARANDQLYLRARQNVIFEVGYFAGVFGRRSGKVILLYKEPVEIPSDLRGVSYVDVSAGIVQAGERIRKEIQHIIDT